jgi:hypothetical protein
MIQDQGGGIVQAKLCDFESATRVGDEFPSGQMNGLKVLRYTKHWVSPEVYLRNQSLQAQWSLITFPTTKGMDVFPMGLVLGCLFDIERSANMTILPDDDDDHIHTALTQPEYLKERITCNSLPSCRDSVHSLCALDTSRRGRLSDALSGLDGFRRNGLQIYCSNQDAIISVQTQVIDGLGRKLDHVVSHLDAQFSSLRQFEITLSSQIRHNADLTNGIAIFLNQMRDSIVPSLDQLASKQDVETFIERFSTVLEENIGSHGLDMNIALKDKVANVHESSFQSEDLHWLVNQLRNDVNWLHDSLTVVLENSKNL